MSVVTKINWNEIQVLPQLVATGEYTFTLLGGKFDEATSRLVVSSAIASGDFTGKRISFSYPNFATQEWATIEFKRLLIALQESGAPTLEEDEDEASYLQRVAGMNFSGKIKHETYTDKESGESRTVAKLMLSSVKPA